MSLSEDSEQIAITITRVEERARALEARIDRTENSIDRAVQLARRELERRLDILNHAHEQSLSDRNEFVTKAEMRWLIGLVVALTLGVVGLLVRGH